MCPSVVFAVYVLFDVWSVWSGSAFSSVRLFMKNLSRLAPVLLALLILSSCAGRSSTPSEQEMRKPLTAIAPSEAETLRQQAEKAKQRGDVSSAIGYWERIIRLYPDYAVAAQAYLAVGRIYIEQNRPDMALQYLEYLIYAYPSWDGIKEAEAARLKVYWLTGRKKDVLNEAAPLFEALAGRSEAQADLGLFMAAAYKDRGDAESALDWLGVTYNAAETPERKKAVVKTGLEIVDSLSEGGARSLLKGKVSDFSRLFLEFRLARIEMQNNPKGKNVRERLKAMLRDNPGHPLAPEIQAAIRGTTGASDIPFNAARIGCLMPLNGENARYGEMVRRGLSMAVDDWNERNSGPRISLSVKDAEGDGSTAAASFEELARKEGVAAVVGPIALQDVKAVTPLADRMSMPLLTLSRKTGEEPESPFALNVFLNEKEMIRTLVRHCKEKLGYTRFATLYPDDKYGQRLSKLFTEAVEEAGGNLYAAVSYKGNTTNFREPIQKLITLAKKNAPPAGTEAVPFDALFLPDQVRTVSLIAPELPYYNIVGIPLLGANLWGETSLVQAGGIYVEQAIFVTPYLADSEAPAVKNFHDRFMAMYNTSPSYLEAQAYDAVSLLLHAQSSGQPLQDRSTLMQNLLQIRSYEGVAGTYSFTPQGELERNYQLYQVVNGSLVRIDR